jgi:2-oxoglutarate ferredoxin oxidoreductase subunit gamma
MHEEIIMAGTGGQGIMIMGQLLAYAALLEGRNVVWLPSYGPEARGGTADCTVMISDKEIGSPVSANPNTLIGMHQFLFDRFQPSVKPGGLLMVNTSLIDGSTLRDDCEVLSIPANTAAESGVGNIRVANMIMLGAYVASSGIVSIESVVAALPEVLLAHRHKFIPLNDKALRTGAELANITKK